MLLFKNHPRTSADNDLFFLPHPILLTEALVEQALVNIRVGSRLLNSTKEAFRVNMDEGHKMGEFLDQIAAASIEEAQGVEQIANALADFDTTIQQNAVIAE
ncbi:MAG: hypothetical protein AB9866_22835 [Syntrophobacteraceae bacterium]